MTTPSPRQRQSAERRAGLAAAALALAGQRSPDEVTTAALAQAVGITQGAVFRHFRNKESAWVAAVETAHAALLGRLRAAAESQSDPLEALRAVFLAHVDYVIEHPGLPRLVFHELQRPQDSLLKSRVRHLMGDYRAFLLERLRLSHGAHRCPEEAHMPAAVLMLMGVVQGLVIQSMLGLGPDAVRQQAPVVFELFQRALNVRPDVKVVV